VVRRALPEQTWQPTDNDPEALRTIPARRDIAGPSNLLPPFDADLRARDPSWGIHIAMPPNNLSILLRVG
jgi:hypothetical protein